MTNLQDLWVQWTNRTPYLMSSKSILTVAHKRILLLKTCHFRSRVGVANVKVGVAKKNRARFAHVLYTRNPLYKILDPALCGHHKIIQMGPVKFGWSGVIRYVTCVYLYLPYAQLRQHHLSHRNAKFHTPYFSNYI